jgi:hypothetical protein
MREKVSHAPPSLPSPERGDAARGDAKIASSARRQWAAGGKGSPFFALG